MAIETTPGTTHDDTLTGIRIATEKTGPSRTEAVTGLEVDTLVKLVQQSQEITARSLAPESGPLPEWTRGETAKLCYWAVITPTLVTGCANMAAHQWGVFGSAMLGGAVAAVGVVLSIAGLNHQWDIKAVTVTFGLTIGGLSFATAAGASGIGWMDAAAWLMAAAGTLGYKIIWNRKHAESKAAVELTHAKTRTERLKGDAVRSGSALKDTYQLMKIQQMQAAATPAAPAFDGATGEERSLRRAFWDVFGHELFECDVRQTLTGWVATASLPVAVPRSTAVARWDGVSSALRANGRFVVTTGTRSDQVVVKFLDHAKAATGAATWARTKVPADAAHVASLGTDTETGGDVMVQFDERLLICGASGTGKSWSARPLLAHAHLCGDFVMIDGKGEEANVWGAVCRVAIEADEIELLIDAVHAEMGRRKAAMAARKISVWDGSQLTVFVDEGQVVLALVGQDKARMQRLRELASLGRSRGIVLWWATQKPTMSGLAPGIDSQMAGNLLQRFSLRVATENEARTALDDCAHYGPQSIPDDRSMRGHGYLKGYGASLVRTWTLDDDAVRALPVRRWEGESERSPQDRVDEYLAANPKASKRVAAAALGIPEGSMGRLIADARKRGVAGGSESGSGVGQVEYLDLADIDPWAE